jgi:hypothetical protein
VCTFEIYHTSYINVLAIAPPIAHENKDDKLHYYKHYCTSTKSHHGRSSGNRPLRTNFQAVNALLTAVNYQILKNKE